MFEYLLSDQYLPFSIALGILFGLLALELFFALIGGTLLGLGADGLDAPDIDGPDVDLPDLAELDIDLTPADLAEADLELTSFDELESVPNAPSGSITSWLGMGKAPAMIWLASVLVGVGLTGLALQSLIEAVFGGPAPAFLVGIPAAVAGIAFARSFGSLFARLLPKTETQSLSERHLGRRMGTVTQGAAARGRPAEVRVSDRYGNTHYLRAEPLRDTDEIKQGTEVLVLRHRYEGGYRIVAVSE